MKNPIVIAACVLVFATIPATSTSDEHLEDFFEQQDIERYDREALDDIESLLGYIQHERTKRYDNVDTLVKKIKNQGIELGYEGAGECAAGICQAYKKEIIEGESGEAQHVLRPLTQNEIAVMADLAMDSAGMKLYGITAMMAQQELNRAIEGAVAGGLGGGMLSMLTGQLREPGAQQGSAAHFNPMSMFREGGLFAMRAGFTIDEAVDSLLHGVDQAQEEELKRRQLMENAEMGPTVEIEDMQLQQIDINNINQTQQTDQGDEFTLVRASFWASVDLAQFTKYTIWGTAQEGRREREFFVESTHSDYREIPGTDLVEPFKSTTCMGGVMTPREQEQMREAQAQLAEFEQQLADMPASQRQMMENMMGSQLETVRSMANDGAMCHSQVIEAVFVNPDLKALYSAGPMDGVVMPTTAKEGNLVQRIQLDLVILGYEPGNTTGELTTGTVIAISQYQAERDMDVTGEATQELAEALTAELMQ